MNIEQLNGSLKKYFGYDEFRTGQLELIQNILSDNDTLGIMPTGAGKSICYQLPATVSDGITIVISPLISLMKDQVDTLNHMGIRTTFINSTLTESETQKRFEEIIFGHYKLIYIAPERLKSRVFNEMMYTVNISMVAIDEAHCVSQWGHDFRSSYKNIKGFIDSFPTRPKVCAFTATATEVVKADVIHLLGLRDPYVKTTGFDRANLKFNVEKVNDKRQYVLNYVRANAGKVGIIYASTRSDCEYLHAFLGKNGVSVALYHGGLNEEERSSAQNDFSFDNIEVMIATNAFGMGIDKSNVRYVLHYNITKNIEAYYQEAGRAGRDGEESECVLLFDPKDINVQSFFIDNGNVSDEMKRAEYEKLRNMVDYCNTTKCLRKYILTYFGEKIEWEECSNCSNCIGEYELQDITLEAQKIFSCVYRANQSWGAGVIAEILRGSKNKKILDNGLNRLSTYSIMKRMTIKEIALLINKLVADGYLDVTRSRFPIIKLNNKSVDILKSKEKLMIKLPVMKAAAVEDQDLFGVLRDVRKEISIEENVPPYVIFSDAALKDMSIIYPQTDNQFLMVKGVGESKLKSYGEKFMETIKIYIEENNITQEIIEENRIKNNRPVNEESDFIDVKKEKKSNKIKSFEVTYNMYKQGKNPLEISEERDIKLISIEEHLVKALREGFDIDIDEFVPEKFKQNIIDKIELIGTERLRPLKDELPEEVEYFWIKLMCQARKSELI